MKTYTYVRNGTAYLLRHHPNHTTDVVMAEVRPAPTLYGPETQLAHYAGGNAQVLGLVSWMFVSGLVQR